MINNGTVACGVDGDSTGEPRNPGQGTDRRDIMYGSTNL